jgi:DNA-binding transcriptional ArsR family regulator
MKTPTIAAKNIERLAHQFRAAGDVTRLKILKAISGQKRICVSEVAERLGLGVAIVSHHMRTLARGGLVSPERQGKRICYVINESDITKLIQKHK